MKKTHLGFWFLCAGFALCTVLVSHEAHAGWASATPTADRVVVNVRGNIVTNVQATKNGATVGGIRGVGTRVIADVPFTCTGGSTLFRYVAKTMESQEPVVMGNASTASMTVPVVLGTGAEFAALCAGTNAGTKTYHLLTQAACIKPGSMPGVDFAEGNQTIQVIVSCDPNYRVPTQSTPVRYRHTCPSGFTVGTTGQQIAETASASTLCVKNGTASGPKG
ncbi:MAG TPA: hypothetical protein PLI95_17570 [Polyangiaceae bacterium]|nr:hypothetical protein [Polyangiaceae bacterium]